MNLTEDILALQKREAYLRAKKDTADTELAEQKLLYAKAKEEMDLYQQTSQLLVDTSLLIQENTTKRVTKLVTDLYQYVFQNDDEFVIQTDTKRKTPVARFLLKTHKGGQEVLLDPTEADGGGKLDVIALGLRLAALLMYKPALNRILILDEPLRFISSSTTSDKPYRYRAVQFLKKMAEQYGIQIIAVTHDSELVDLADARFEFALDDKGYTTVGEL